MDTGSRVAVASVVATCPGFVRGTLERTVTQARPELSRELPDDGSALPYRDVGAQHVDAVARGRQRVEVDGLTSMIPP